MCGRYYVDDDTAEEIEKCSSVENLVGKEKYALTKIRINPACGCKGKRKAASDGTYP